jgi:hypothetical protein
MSGILREIDSTNIEIIGGIAKMEKHLDCHRAKNKLIDSIKSHKIAIDVAIKTGDMSQVRQANEEYYSREIAEAEGHSYG